MFRITTERADIAHENYLDNMKAPPFTGSYLEILHCCLQTVQVQHNITKHAPASKRQVTGSPFVTLPLLLLIIFFS